MFMNQNGQWSIHHFPVGFIAVATR